MKSEIAFIALFNFIQISSSQNNESDSSNPYSFTGQLKWGYRKEEHYLEFEPRSLGQCAEECYARKRCKTFSYSQTLSLCELSFMELEVESAITGVMLPDNHFLTSSIATWPKFLFGNCRDHNCTENERCTKNGKCEISDCGAPPSELQVCGAKLLEYSHHEINNGVIFGCINGLTMVLDGQIVKANRYVVACDQKGRWGNISFTCEFMQPPFDGENETCLSNHNGAFDTTCNPLFVTVQSYIFPCEEQWIIIQRRVDGSVDFYRNWDDYKQGFGNVTGEYWIGNSLLHKLTSKERYKLRIELEDFEGEKRFANYASLSVGDETSKYRLFVSGYSGNAGDSFSYHNGMAFSTKDEDNDIISETNCALSYRGAWWYKACHNSNLNGLYFKGEHTSYADGVNWLTWKGSRYSLKSCRIMIRRY